MKVKPPVRTMARTLMVVGAVTVGAGSLMVAGSRPALADPAVSYVAAGSDTIQDVVNQFSYDIGGNALGSYNAVNPVTQTIGEIITPVKAGSPTSNCSFTRPNGSTQGLNALRKSINQSTTAAQLASPPQAGCVDIGRSSSGPGTNQSATGALVYIPFALDAVTGAVGGTTNLSTANMFTLTDLTNLYKNCTTVTEGGVTYNPGTAATGQVQINLYVPQPGSGTLSFWANTLGFSSTSLPACVHQTIVGTTTLVEENDGTAVSTDPNGYMPFSIAQWISQRNGHNDRRHGAVEQNINGVSPFNGTAASGTLNTAFPVTREVYDIVQFSRVSAGGANFDPNLTSLLVGASSSLCQDVFTITGYGFAALGSSNDACGAITSNLRAFDPTTNPV
jgi:hypothetical protein